jgi:hypothetical protein
MFNAEAEAVPVGESIQRPHANFFLITGNSRSCRLHGAAGERA